MESTSLWNRIELFVAGGRCAYVYHGALAVTCGITCVGNELGLKGISGEKTIQMNSCSRSERKNPQSILDGRVKEQL